MKFNYIVLFLCIFQVFCQETAAPTNNNPYASDPKVRHSLFKDKNTWNRISGDEQGVPTKINTEEVKSFQNPESYVAFKIAKYYKNVFEFLDEDVDDFLMESDLVHAYKAYNWPMPNDVSIEEYVKEKFKLADLTHRGKIDFVEFCHFMEDVWKYSEFDIQRNCVSALRKAINVFDRLFEYLDQDRDGFVDTRNVKFGVSFVTGKNIDSDDVDRAFKEYDKEGKGKLNKSEFILAAMNGQLLRSVENPSITSTFFG